MKTTTKRLIIGLACVGLVTIVIATYRGAANYLSKGESKPTPCGSPQTIRFVKIEHSKVIPAHTAAKHCDKLSIINKDDMLRLMAFGQHDHHVEYDGISEKALTLDRQLTITLDHTGDFMFHDHLHDEVQGTFSVQE